MARLNGNVSLTGLPARRGLQVSLCLFAVGSAETPAPYGGDPPGTACHDCEKLFDEADLTREWRESSFQQAFSVTRGAGFYFMQVRVILFRENAGKVYAQAEQFFFTRRPVELLAAQTVTISLPVEWPTTPIEELHRYGTVQPRRKRPWWRFWRGRRGCEAVTTASQSGARQWFEDYSDQNFGEWMSQPLLKTSTVESAVHLNCRRCRSDWLGPGESAATLRRDVA